MLLFSVLPPGAILRPFKFRLHFKHPPQQSPLADPRWWSKRSGQFEWHRQRIENLNARLEYPRPNSPMFVHDVHLHLFGHIRTLQIRGLGPVRWFLFLFYEFNNNRLWWYGARFRSISSSPFKFNNMVLFNLYFIGDGVNCNVFQCCSRRISA